MNLIRDRVAGLNSFRFVRVWPEGLLKPCYYITQLKILNLAVKIPYNSPIPSLDLWEMDTLIPSIKIIIWRTRYREIRQ